MPREMSKADSFRKMMMFEEKCASGVHMVDVFTALGVLGMEFAMFLANTSRRK